MSSDLGIGPAYLSVTLKKENLKNHKTGVAKVKDGTYFIVDFSGDSNGKVWIKKKSAHWQQVEISKIEGTMTGKIYTLSNGILLYNKLSARTFDGKEYKDLNVLENEEKAKKIGIDLV